MSVLSYKTRGNSSPQGKPRVYFTSHPKDRDLYFDKVVNMLLSMQNCAVYYSEDGYLEDRELTLSQMQLFIIPVTMRLLTEENEAMDKDYPFAEEHHIPILPIMEENGLDELFQKRFGNLQYLSPNIKDDTVLSFEEKLQKYLKGILIKDDLAEKVRAAFDAYIFLSYRKKDRVYAQRLMKLIHRIPNCQDIAIWYDEYLVPGEDFNDSIEEALKKSDLFTLVVTPNLINESNYVLTTEYPMARKANKLVIPVEMVETDKALLRQKYDKLPDCLSGRESLTFSKEFMKAMQDLARSESMDHPEHNFLIGLAYLDGIDVEVDQERAVELIEKAAEQDVIEAMEQLVSMFEHGKGVTRDYLQGLYWRRKLVQKLRKDGDLSALFNALRDKKDAESRLGRTEECRQSCQEMLETAEILSASKQKGYKRALMLSYLSLGDYEWNLSHKTEAKEWYEKGVQISEEWAASEESDALQNLAVLYSIMGDVEADHGYHGVADDWYKKSLEINEKLVNMYGLLPHRQNLACDYELLGDNQFDLEHYDEAYIWYQRCMEYRKTLYEETKSEEDLLNLGDSYINIGDTLKMQGHLSSAKIQIEKALAAYQEAFERSQNILDKRYIFKACSKLGEVELKLGFEDRGRKYYEKSLVLREEVAGAIETVESRRALALGYSDMGEIEVRKGNYKEGREWFLKSLSAYEEMVNKTDSVDIKYGLANSYRNLGFFEKEHISDQDAERSFLRAVNLYKDTIVNGAFIEDYREKAVCCIELGKMREEKKAYQEALDFYREAYESEKVYNQIFDEDSFGVPSIAADIKSKIDHVENNPLYLHQLAEMALTEKNYDHALMLLRKERDCLLNIATSSKQLADYRSYILNLIYIADLERSVNENRAITDYENVLKIQRAFVPLTNNSEDWHQLALSMEKLGRIYQNKKEMEKAEKLFKEAFPIRENLFQKVHSLNSYHNIAVAYMNLGNIKSLTQQNEDAKKYFEKALYYENYYSEKTGKTADRDQFLRVLDILNKRLAQSAQKPKKNSFFDTFRK